MPRGGYRPGSGRKPGTGKKDAPVEAQDMGSQPPREHFDSAYAFGLWALNAPDNEVTMDQKIRAMGIMATIEVKKPESLPKMEQARAGAEKSMSGAYAPRTVKGFGVVDGGK